MKYITIPKPKAGDKITLRGRIQATLTRRRGFGDWEATTADGKVYRVQGLAEVDLLRLVTD